VIVNIVIEAASLMLRPGARQLDKSWLPLTRADLYDGAQMQPVTLAIIEGSEQGHEFSVEDSAVIGRDPDADITIADDEISSRHANVMAVEDGIAIEDLGSTNGTFVNGSRISGAQRLSAGDRLQLGTTVIEVRIPAAAPAPDAPAPSAAPDAPAPSAAPDAPDAPAPSAAPDAPAPSAVGVAPDAVQATGVRLIPTLPVLMFIKGQYAGSEIGVGSPVVIGRDRGVADVILDRDTEISRRHASFSPAGTGITVQDLGSTNGTFVNGHRVTGAVALSNGDRVEMGDTVIEVRLASQPIAPTPAAAPPRPPPRTSGRPNDIVVEGLVKEFGKHRAVDGISLHVDPGEIYGFLGPNGAGKSTTVHMLTTLMPPSGGVARIGGFDVAKQGAQVRATIGVALQAAALDDQLNSWEHMDLQMALQGVPKSDRRKRRVELIERVGLTYAADRRVGGYSGGMKRRLDLALALVHEPRVLFLDEPTTGLDPQSRTSLWEEVARLVKEEGMTVFLTTQYLEEADVLADRVGIIDHGEMVAEDTPAGLKAEIGRPTVEVAPASDTDWAAVSSVLERFGEIVNASNRGVAVRLSPEVDGLAAVIRALDAEGLAFVNVELHAPTLDDVFLIKTGRTIEDSGASSDAAEVTIEDSGASNDAAEVTTQ
jgi:ABC-2 type transport system ATP-binding protein